MTEDRAALRKALCLRFGAIIADAMDRSGTTFDIMAAALDVEPDFLRVRYLSLLDGHDIALEHIADMLWACNARIRIELTPR